MIHPDTELRPVSEVVGLGVFAIKPIPKGSIVYVKDMFEISIPLAEMKNIPNNLLPSINRYSFIESDGTRVVSWDHAKYVNHCCNANTLSTGYGFEIAIRDIATGEEMTDDYGLLNIEAEMQLCCGNKDCRVILKPDDFDQHVEKWDAQVSEALNSLRKVSQPLYDLMDVNTVCELESYLNTGRGYQSVSTVKLRETLHYTNGVNKSSHVL